MNKQNRNKLRIGIVVLLLIFFSISWYRGFYFIGAVAVVAAFAVSMLDASDHTEID